MSDTIHLFIITTLAAGVAGSFTYSYMLFAMLKKDAVDLRDHASNTAANLKKSHDEAMGNCHARITREMQRFEQSFYEYKLHVANSFASLAHLAESERRTQHSLEGINAKLDRLIENRGKL